MGYVFLGGLKVRKYMIFVFDDFIVWLKSYINYNCVLLIVIVYLVFIICILIEYIKKLFIEFILNKC